jgi:hypothetical protein
VIRTGRLGTPRFVTMLNAPTETAAPWIVAGALPSTSMTLSPMFVATVSFLSRAG